MDIDSYIYEAVFSETPKYKVFYELVWEQFKEDGFAVVDDEGFEIDCILKAVSMQNLISEFNYRLYDEINETGVEDILCSLETLGFTEENIIEYCKGEPEIEINETDFELTLKNALDHTTETVADKLLEYYSPTDLFDYMFTATYDFEQDFTFDFEDCDEFLAFIDSNTDRLDNYKDEYPAVLSWIENGMVC